MPSADNTRATMDALAHAVVARFGDHVMGLNLGGGRSGFLWEHAVDAAGDRVLECLITGGAELPTPGGLYRRTDLVDPRGRGYAEILSGEFGTERLPIDLPDVTVLPFSLWHEHAERRGWRWRTRPFEAETVDAVNAYRAVLVLGLRRYSDETVGWSYVAATPGPDEIRFGAPVPDGFVGGPVLSSNAGGSAAFVVRLSGVAVAPDRAVPF